jgi:tape measure domain-containing protein
VTTTVGVTRVIEVDVKASANAAAHLKQIADQMGGLDKTAKSSQGAMQGFFDSVLSSAKGMVGFFVGNKAMEIVQWFTVLSDNANVLNNRFKLVTGSTEGMNIAMAEVSRIAREQGRDIDGTAKLYEKITRQQEQLGITTKGVSVMTEGFAASLRLSGSGTNEANAAMVQFAQALASGKLAGDEFRSMMENNPVFMYKLAEAAGVTQGKLKDMSKDGKIDMEFLRTALFKVGEDGTNALQKLIKDAEKLPKTTAQAVEGVKTSLTELLSAIGMTASQSEGIFVRMLKGIQNAMSTAAQFARDEAEFQRQKNIILGKEADNTPKGELDAMGKSNAQMRDRQKGLMERADMAGRRLAALPDNEANQKARARIQEQIDDYQADYMALEKVIERNIKQREKLEEGATMLVNGWKPEPKEDKKKKRDNPWSKLLGDITDAEEGLEEKIAGWGKWRSKVEDLLREEQRKGKEGILPTKKQYSDAVEAANAQDEFEARQKENAERVKKGRARVMHETDEYLKDLQHADSEIKKALGQFDEDTGKRLGTWGKRFEDLTDMLQRNKDKMTEDDWKKLSKYWEFLRGKSEFEKDKADAMELFDKDRGTDLGKSSINEYGKAFEDAFNRMTDSVLQFNKTAKALVEDFALDFLRQMARIATQRAMQPAMDAAVGWISSITAGLAGGGGSAMTANRIGMNADGAVLNGPTYLGYSNGAHQIGGEAGPEAVMPLSRGADGKLGLGATPVTVNVINNANGTKATASESTNSSGNREITVMIEQVVEGALSGGKMDKVLRDSFSLTRKGKG